jgi:RNA polymerase sigma-70 factor (ECF subfamily)
LDRAPKSKESQAAGAARTPVEPSLRLVARHESADELLYERLAPIVNRLIWTVLGPDPERDDLAHEIFIRILRGAAKVRDASRLEGWAARVTTNAIKNEFRRRKLRRWFSLEMNEDPEALHYHPDFEGREVLLRTYKTLERLPARERLAFSLRLLEQASAEEIARVCGCSLRTIKRRLKSGRTRFLKLAAADPLLGPRLANVPAEGDDDE